MQKEGANTNTKRKGSIFILADTHFCHEKILEFRDSNYEKKIASFLFRLREEDILIHLGDICIGRDAFVHDEYIKPLKCKKILIKGNHDHKSRSWYLNHGRDWVCKQMYDVYFGKRILFSHVPKPYQDRYDYNIHGHLHDKSHRILEFIDFYDYSFNKLISIEKSGYEPVNLRTFIEKLNEKNNK